MTRTAWVYFHPIVDRMRSEEIGARVDESFYTGPHWPARANSTDRLTSANYLAMQRLGASHEVDFLRASDAEQRLGELLTEYDNVVVNIVSSARAATFLKTLASTPTYDRRSARVIFGTEMTPFRTLSEGGITAREIEMLYFENLLLRHTARTDIPLYIDRVGSKSQVLEFPLGVDTDSLLPESASTRRLITFVRAPAGRETKNNESIDEILQLIKYARSYPGLTPYVLETPYTNKEFWDTMRCSAALIFTSRGETFSYVMNDALALGVPALIRAEMFSSQTPQFGADSYIGHGIRYRSYRHLLESLDKLIYDPDEWMRASRAGRASVVDRFSIDSVASAWDAVLSGTPAPRRTLLVVDGTAYGNDPRKAAQVASDTRSDLVMFDRNRGWSARPVGAYSEVVGPGVAVLRHYLSEIDGEVWRYDREASRGARVVRENPGVTREFVHLVCRLNHVTSIKIDRALEGGPLHVAATAWAHSPSPGRLLGRAVDLVDLA